MDLKGSKTEKNLLTCVFAGENIGRSIELIEETKEDLTYVCLQKENDPDV